MGWTGLLLPVLAAAAPVARGQEAGGTAPASPERSGVEPAAAGEADEPPPEEGGSEERRAMLLFEAGQALYDAGRFVEAAERFEEAHALSGRPALLFNASVAWRDAGRLDRAADALRRYLQELPADAEGRPRLEARLQRLQDELARQRAARAERERLEAERRERARRAEREAAEGPSPLPWYVVGAGGGLLALGLAAGALALSAEADVEAGCGGPGCPFRPIYDDYEQDVSRLRTWATAADLLLISGALVAAGGLSWALLRSGPGEGAERPEAGGARLRLAVLPGATGLSLEGAW